jgi:hypothetical protein
MIQMKIKVGKNIIACVVILMVMIPGVSALVPANPPQPSYITHSSEVITVDGYYSDWDLDKDFFADMYNEGNSDIGFSGFEIFSKLYLRYDCASEILYVLVLCENGNMFEDDSSGMWVKEHSLFYPSSKKIIGMNGGDPGNIIYIENGNDEIIGYEASGSLPPGNYNQFDAHAQMNNGDTSSTGKIPLMIDCNNYDVPEFPTVALPIMMILGIMFILQSRKRKED